MAAFTPAREGDLVGSPTLNPTGLDAAMAKLFPGPQDAMAATAPVELDPYANLDREKLLKRFKDAKKAAQDLRWPFEQLWWKIMLYLSGRQWIFFDQRRNQWRDKRLARWIPKPVTNYLRNGVISIRAVMTSMRLGVTVRPQGGDVKNVATANIADQVEPAIADEHDIQEMFFEGDYWAASLGNWFMYLWWDNQDPKNGAKPVNADVCPTCQQQAEPQEMPQMCPECGSQMALQQVGTEIIGRGKTDVVSPFEILFETSLSRDEEIRKLIRSRWRSKDYAEALYPELAPKIVYEKSASERSLRLFKSLATLTEMTKTPNWSGAGSSESEGYTEYEYWEQPSKEYPDGLFFKIVGENNPFILEDAEQSSPGPLPHKTKQGKPLWPWVHVSFEPVGGRVWALGALEGGLQKQDQINRLDSRIELIVDRMSNPVWVIPKGEEVGAFMGEPGWVLRYPLIGPNTPEPKRIDGQGPNQSLFALREQYVRDLEESLGTFDILKGQRPPNVEAFSALQLLVERSQSRFATAFKKRAKAYKEWYTIALELERAYGPTERVHNVLGPNKTWTAYHFENAQLDGDVQIVVEDGSETPKTKLGERAAIEQANQMGFIDRADPEQRYHIFGSLGLQKLSPALDNDVKSALREQDEFEKWVAQGLPGGPPASPLQRMEWHQDTVHLVENRKWMNTDKFLEMVRDPQFGPIVRQLAAMHLQEHAGMLMAAQAPQGPPGSENAGGGQPSQPEDGRGGGRAMQNSNQESGGTKAVPAGQGEGPHGQSVQGPA